MERGEKRISTRKGMRKLEGTCTIVVAYSETAKDGFFDIQIVQNSI